MGGSTRMPRIHSELRCYFENCPKTRLSFSMRSGEPVKAVALGAAYYGQSLMSSFSREDDGESMRTSESLKKLSNCIMTDIASRNIMLKVNKRNSGKIGFIRLIRKGEFLPYRHSHIFHPRNRGQRTISLEIYDCAASFNSRYVTIDDVDKVSTEFQKIGDLKFSIEDRKKKKSKSRPRKGTWVCRWYRTFNTL